MLAPYQPNLGPHQPNPGSHQQNPDDLPVDNLDKREFQLQTHIQTTISVTIYKLQSLNTLGIFLYGVVLPFHLRRLIHHFPLGPQKVVFLQSLVHYYQFKVLEIDIKLINITTPVSQS